MAKDGPRRAPREERQERSLSRCLSNFAGAPGPAGAPVGPEAQHKEGGQRGPDPPPVLLGAQLACPERQVALQIVRQGSHEIFRRAARVPHRHTLATQVCESVCVFATLWVRRAH